MEVEARIVRLELAETFVISRESSDYADVLQVALSHDGVTGQGSLRNLRRLILETSIVTRTHLSLKKDAPRMRDAQGAVFLLDRDSASALTLTLWENEEAALETDKHADKNRASTVAATGMELVARGRYEVVARLDRSST